MYSCPISLRSGVACYVAARGQPALPTTPPQSYGGVLRPVWSASRFPPESVRVGALRGRHTATTY
eukprot:1813599-Prymnesium_polylepis.1